MNSVEVHPQLSSNGHPVDGALVGVAHWRYLRRSRLFGVCRRARPVARFCRTLALLLLLLQCLSHSVARAVVEALLHLLGWRLSCLSITFLA